MKILIDSNIIISDYTLKKGESILFLRNFEDSGCKCYISKITYEEIIGNFKKHLKSKIENYNTSVNKIERQIRSGLIELDESYFESKLGEYKRLLDLKLGHHNIEIYPIVEVSHEKILKHLFERKHPFDSKDNGYKDYLIFETALELLKDDILILLSNDNDFGESELHHDLQELNTTGNKVILRKSFEEINNNELKTTISEYNAKLQFITEVFKEDDHQESYINSVIDFLENESLEIFPDLIYDNIDILDTPDLEYVKFFRDTAKVKSVKPISEKIVLVKFDIKAYLKYLFVINSSNNHQLQNLPNDIQISKTHEGYETIIDLGYWYDLEVFVQANMEGGEMQFWDLKMIKR